MGLTIALALAVLAAAMLLIRRPAIPRLTVLMIGLGAALVAIAAGMPIGNQAVRQQVAVMVDLSPSTRTADYRDRTFLDRRIHELLRAIPYKLQFFSDHTTSVVPVGATLADMPATRTRYAPPKAAAVLLFSDCRFDLPRRSPPAYVVVDSGLDDTDDAAISDLEVRGNQVAVTINNPGSTRRLTLDGVAGTMPASAPLGSMVMARPLAARARRVSAELSPGDAWPENDALSAIPPPPDQYERWWVGRSSGEAGWRALSAAQLPTDPAAYLAPGVIVLDDLAASDLSGTQQQRLLQYVRDIGGGIEIVGGDHAFAAGGYDGTTLDSMSPLAGDPPGPTTHWVLLLDSSGSMSAPAGPSTRWDRVTHAIAQLLPHLPPQDLVSIGSFSDTLHWWAQGQTLEAAQSLTIPPHGAYPHGPTNLQPALQAIAAAADGKMSTQLLVLSDFDTRITDPDSLGSMLKSKDIRLNLLAIGEGTALPALRGISAKTGGAVMTQFAPAQWASAVQELAHAASARRIEQDAITVHFRDEASALPPQQTSRWNRVWVKQTATKLADARQASQTVAMAARWNIGEGQALAIAFDPGPGQVRRLSDLIARPPHDPRFHVTWDTGGQLHVTVDGQENGSFLDGERITLELSGQSAGGPAEQTLAVPQTAPGHYELARPAPRSPGLATVRAGGRVVGQIAIAGRYAPEFEAIGNDHPAMIELARRSGGRVIAPDQTAPLDIQWPRHPIPLASPLAMAGALLIALGLVWWRAS